MNLDNKQEDNKEHYKSKLFDNIYSKAKNFPINEKIQFIENYFKDKCNLDILNDEKLKTYISILYKKYNNYEKLKYCDKINLIKTENLRDEFIDGKFKFDIDINNNILFDFVLLKEIQAEEEKNENKIKVNSKNIQSKKEKNKSKGKFPYCLRKDENGSNKDKKEIKKEPQKSNKIIQIIERISDNLFVWIDENYKNKENSSYLNLLKKNNNLSIICFDNIDEAFNFLLLKEKLNNEDEINKLKFNAIYILISGRLYPDYYKKLKENIINIIFIPICCIFTSLKLLKEIEANKITYKEINSPFYNKEGIKTNFIECIKSFEKFNIFYKSKSINLTHKKINKSYDGCLTFEQIYSKSKLVLPFLFNKIMENAKNKTPNKEIINFENFLLNNFKEEKLHKLIISLLYIKDLPREILPKFFARMYTEQTTFFSEMNKSLMKKEKNYNIFVKVMYEGLHNGSFQRSENDILYRGSRMTKKEIDNIKKSFEEWNKMEDKSLPKFLLYSRTFLSFTKSKILLKRFVGKTDDNFYGTIFILQNNKNISNKYSSNADIEYISKFPDEKEVLFFPYTTFYLKNIYEEKYENQKCIFMQIDYLGQYEYVFEQFKNDENFKKEVINSPKFSESNYSNEIIKSELIPLDDDNKEKEKKDDYYEKEKATIFFEKVLLKFQNINEEVNEEIKNDILKNENKEPEKEINDSERPDKNESSNNDIINVTFNFLARSKVVISTPKNMTLEELFNNFAKKSGIDINNAEDPIVFVYNATKLEIKSKQLISSVLKNFNEIITVFESKSIVGAFSI